MLSQLKRSELLISPEQLALRLGSKIDALWKSKPTATNAEWTKQVKGFLHEIAKSLERPEEHLSIEVLYTDRKSNTHEFLLDLVWWCRIGEPAEVEFMALAAEIEWASFWWGSPGESLAGHIRDRVGEDFGKLTVVNAPIKLMMFCTDKSGPDRTHGPMQKIVLDEIDRYLRPYAHHIPGETYVLIDVASDGNRCAWVRTVDDQGILSDLETLEM
jgi:hypothetical protein